MRPLSEFHTAFAKALTSPGQHVPHGLAVTGGAPLAQRMDVYRNNVYASLLRALEESFPVTQRLVGEAFFKTAARIYLEDHLPRSPVLLEFGEDFPDFLAAFPPAAALPYLPDVARLERLYLDAFHAPDAQPLVTGALTRLGPDALARTHIRLHPALRLFRSPFAVFEIWHANQPGAERGDKLQAARPEQGWCRREGLRVAVETVPPGLFTLLQALQGEDPLGLAAERAAAQDPDFNLTNALTQALKHNLFAAAQNTPQD